MRALKMLHATVRFSEVCVREGEREREKEAIVMFVRKVMRV